MKYLSQFQRFDIDGFLKDKSLMTTAVKEWFEYDEKGKKTDKCLGTMVEAVITNDATPYNQKDGEQATNRFEKITFKIPKKISVPLNVYVTPVNAKGKIYGDYRNKLSVTADDIKVLQPKKGA